MLPLAKRGLSILRRRGEVPDITIDGHQVDLRIVSPIALHRQRAEAQSAIQWLQLIASAAPDAMGIVNRDAAARWLAKAYRVPDSLLKTPDEIEKEIAAASQMAGGVLPNILPDGGGGAGMSDSTMSPQSDPLSRMAAEPSPSVTGEPFSGAGGHHV